MHWIWGGTSDSAGGSSSAGGRYRVAVMDHSLSNSSGSGGGGGRVVGRTSGSSSRNALPPPPHADGNGMNGNEEHGNHDDGDDEGFLRYLDDFSIEAALENEDENGEQTENHHHNVGGLTAFTDYPQPTTPRKNNEMVVNEDERSELFLGGGKGIGEGGEGTRGETSSLQPGLPPLHRNNSGVVRFSHLPGIAEIPTNNNEGIGNYDPNEGKSMEESGELLKQKSSTSFVSPISNTDGNESSIFPSNDNRLRYLMKAAGVTTTSSKISPEAVSKSLSTCGVSSTDQTSLSTMESSRVGTTSSSSSRAGGKRNNTKVDAGGSNSSSPLTAATTVSSGASQSRSPPSFASSSSGNPVNTRNHGATSSSNNTTANASINTRNRPKPINTADQLFDSQHCEENIFWKAYTELEQKKYDQRGVKTFWQFILFVIRWNIKRMQYANTTEVHTMSPSNRSFWLFFLERTQYIGLTVYGFNAAVVLLFFITVICWNFESYQRQFEWYQLGDTQYNNEASSSNMAHSGNLNSSSVWGYYESSIIQSSTDSATYQDTTNNEAARLRLSFVMYILTWLVAHVCGFLLYLMVYWKSSRQRLSSTFLGYSSLYFGEHYQVSKHDRQYSIKDSDILTMWSVMTRTIFMSRTLQLVTIAFVSLLNPLLEGQNTNHICFGIGIVPSFQQDYTSVVIVSIFDIYQVLVLAFLPAPWPWMLRIVTIELISTFLKLSTCSFLIADFNMKSNFLMCIFIGIFLYYIFILAGSSLYFENSMRNAFANIQEQQIATKERQQLVNMLCQEVKLPAQEVLQILTTLSSRKQSLVMAMGGVEVDAYLDAAKAFSNTLNALVDDFLFLTKVEEGRFTMQFNDSINVVELFQQTIKVLIRSIKWPYQDVERFVVLQHQQQTSLDVVYGEQSCLRAIIYHSILCILALICNDKLEDLPKIVAESMANNPINGSTTGGSSSNHEPLLSITTYQTKRRKVGREAAAVNALASAKIQENSDGSTPNPAPVEPEALYLHVTILVNPDDAVRLIHSRPRLKRDGSYQGLFESTCMICQKLTKASKGSWSVYRNRIEFSVRIHSEASMDGRRPIKLPTWLEKALKTNPPAPTNTTNISASQAIAMNIGGMTSTGISSTNTHPADTVHKPDRTSTIQATETCKMLLQNARISPMLVYLTDPSYETVILEVLDRLFGEKHQQIPIQNTLSKADLKHYKLLIVMSISSCQELRLKNFRGEIVLFSERLTYLDEYEETLFDYSVPLPCQEHTLITLAEYLRRTLLAIEEDDQDVDNESGLGLGFERRKRDKGRKLSQWSLLKKNVSQRLQATKYLLPNSARGYVKKRLMESYSVASSEDNVEHRLQQQLGEHFIFEAPHYRNQLITLSVQCIHRTYRFIRETMLLVAETIRWIWHPVHESRRESYVKWRTLSPIGVYGHHTMYVESLISVAIVSSLMYRLLGITSIRACFTAVIVLTTFSSRSIVYNYCLRPYNISYATVWTVCSWVNFFIPIAAIITEFIGWRNGIHPYVAIQETRRENKTLLDYALHQHADTTGLQSLLYVILAPNYIRFQLEFFSWPYGFISAGIVTIRTLAVFILYLSPYFIKSQNSFIVSMIVLMSLTLGAYQYLIEKLNSESFTTLYDLLILKDFKDRLLFVGNVTFTQPLLQLQELQTVFLESICNQAFQDKVWITKELHGKMSLLRSNIMLSKELLMQLKISEPSFFRQPRTIFLSSMKAKLIIQLVNRVCSNVLAGFADDLMLSVKIVFKLHPAIALVRVDEELFIALLGSVCRRAIQQIRYQSNNSAGGGKASDMMSREIFLWIRPDEESSKNAKKFTDIRTMLITAFDMCPSAASACFTRHSNSRDNDNIRRGNDGMDAVDTGNKGKSEHGTGTSTSATSMASFAALSSSSFPLCDRFMQYFGQSSRYSADNLDCSLLYKHYQQIAIPYLLCRDSYKLQVVLERVGFHNQLHAVHSIHLHAYQVYKQSNIELIDEVDRLVANAGYYRHRYTSNNSVPSSPAPVIPAKSTSSKPTATATAKDSATSASGIATDDANVTSNNNAGSDSGKASTSQGSKRTKKQPQVSGVVFASPGRTTKTVPMSPKSATLIHGMQTIYKFTNSSQWTRSYTGNALIFCLDTSEHVARYLRSHDHFQSIGWSCHSVIVKSIHDILWRLDSFTNYSNISASGKSTARHMTYDCLIFDVDIEKVLALHSNEMDAMLHPTAHRYQHKQQAHGIDDIKGLVHVIRSYGFTGLVTVTHPNPEKFYRSTGLNNTSSATTDRVNYYIERRQKLESHSPYTEAVSVDLHLTLPFTETSIQQIARMCEWNVYKSL